MTITPKMKAEFERIQHGMLCNFSDLWDEAGPVGKKFLERKAYEVMFITLLGPEVYYARN